MTLALECGLLTPLYCTTVALLMKRDTVDYIANPGVEKCGRELNQKLGTRKHFFTFYTSCICYACCMAKLI